MGDGAVFPNCPQHQVANLVGSLDGNPPVLSGAVVEGPNSFAETELPDGMRACPASGENRFKPFDGNGAVYADDARSYSTVEPAIDLSASSFLMFAWQIAGAPAKFVPSADIAAAVDEPVAAAPNPQWPPRRTRAKRWMSRNGPTILRR